MPIELVESQISKLKLLELAKERFGDLVKAVVDIEQEIMALGGELHADEESFLIERGSLQKNLWGINIYPESSGENFIEFDSMINLRPSHGNPSRDVLDPKIRNKIQSVVTHLIRES